MVDVCDFCWTPAPQPKADPSLLQFCVREKEWPNHCMRADSTANVALDAFVLQFRGVDSQWTFTSVRTIRRTSAFFGRRLSRHPQLDQSRSLQHGPPKQHGPCRRPALTPPHRAWQSEFARAARSRQLQPRSLSTSGSVDTRERTETKQYCVSIGKYLCKKKLKYTRKKYTVYIYIEREYSNVFWVKSCKCVHCATLCACLWQWCWDWAGWGWPLSGCLMTICYLATIK